METPDRYEYIQKAAISISAVSFFIMISYDADQRNSIWSSLEIGLLKSYVILYYMNCHIGKH
ncbi:MAG: hypothetical protein EGP80_07870 [Blautia wexlerae]|nr:hypothetical protein [Blautia wexlerae]